jgi:hypothetical protein
MELKKGQKRAIGKPLHYSAMDISSFHLELDYSWALLRRTSEKTKKKKTQALHALLPDILESLVCFGNKVLNKYFLFYFILLLFVIYVRQ